MTRRGATIVEAVFASAILFSAFLVMAALFHSGLHFTTKLEKNQQSILIAQSTLEQMRAYASNLTNYQDWSAYDGVTTEPADFPGFRVTTTVARHTLYSGCSQMETSMPSGQQRVPPDSAVQVKVKVSWDQGSSQTSLSALIGEPGRLPLSPVAIQITPAAPLPAQLARDVPFEFQASARDSLGNPLPNVFFKWIITSIDGNGTLTQTRSGTTANLTNQLLIPGTGPVYTGGRLYVVAMARIKGSWVSGRYGPVVLAP